MSVVRLAGPGDEYLIERLVAAAFGPFRNLYTPDAFDYTAIKADAVRGRFAEGPIWLAYLGDLPAGTVSGLPDGERFYIRSMGVIPDAQGKGVGQQLLGALEKHAREEGFKSLYLYTTFVLPGARPLYEKNGFYILRETPPEEWFGMAGIEMEKILD
ncbi:MAG: GNAT family N-acetyltransferase [Chloracidobacterium sp.]|nr:GNAT family N-acetyltransferase [Chloracidobacterium sp.]